MVGRKSRRAFLIGSTVAVAGCVSLGGDDVKDSDGDGVIDSKDYAPNDPDVQEKSDLAGTETPAAGTPNRSMDSPTGSPTPTPTRTPTRTPTPTPTSRSTPSANTLSVSDSYWEESTRILEYDVDQVRAKIIDDSELGFNDLQVLVEAYQYPRGDLVASATSNNFSSAELPITLSVDIEESLPENERLHYVLYLTRAGKETSELDSSEISFLFETDPFSIDSRTIGRDPHPADLGPESVEGYERDVVEGAYAIKISGTSMGTNWDAYFHVYRSAYLERSQASRGRSRPEYVTYEINEGFASGFAGLLDGIAEDIGFAGDREKVEFVIDLVQRLPYVPDDVSTGYDDYTKFILETITEGEGDCEDTSIMLAATLQAEPFGYDMVLIQPPGHMAAGIYTSDPSGYYWEHEGRKYSYIETTGEGWGIGDLPEEYQGTDAYVLQV